MKLLQKIRTLFRKEQLEADMSEEMRLHLEQRTRENLAAGMSPEDARYAALKKFGGMEQAKEIAREQRAWAWIEHLGVDLRYAARQLRQAPGFAATAIFTIAVGIGSCTALFSIVNGVLLHPLRFPEPERIVRLDESRPPNASLLTPAPGAYLDWLEQSTAFAQIGANSWRGFNTRQGSRMINISGLAVTANYFALLGVEPILGRAFRPEETAAGRDHVAILSYSTWQNSFGGRPEVLNETIVLNDQPFTIVGVMPDRNVVWNAAVYVPFGFPDSVRNDYGSHGGFLAFARLKPGVTLAQAQGDMDRISANIARAHPASNEGHGALVQPLLDSLTGDIRLQLLTLLSAVGFVLLIACVNVASLLLARANARQREIAVRAALGASRGRIVRQFLAESLLVSLLGGALGTAIAYGSLGALSRFVARYVPRTEEIAVDGPVLAVSLGLMLLAGLGVGLLPALQFTRGDLAEPLKDAGRGSSGGRKRQRLRAALVVVEIALATMLLAGTGLLARSLAALERADLGFKTADVFTNRVGLGGKKYDSNEKAAAFIDTALERVGALPDVAAVAFSDGLPMIGARGLLFHVVGTPEVPVRQEPHVGDFVVTPDFFKAMGIPLVRGRGFTAQDRVGAPRVVVVNQELVRRHFPNVDPIGQRLMIMTMADTPDAVREIVGVVGDIRANGPQSRLESQAYEPFAQVPSPGGWNLIVTAKGPAPALSTTVSDVLRAIDSDLPVRNLRPYQLFIASAWVRQQFSMTLFIGFSGIALLLAAIGIYGVMAYSVSQRTQEIGIRMALGASGRDVLGLVLGSATRMLAAGLLLGIAGALAFARVLQSLLFQTSAADGVTLLGVATLLTIVALLACWVPAWRATKVNPMTALRAE